MHLTDIEKTIYAEALIKKEENKLETKLVEHVCDCIECSVEIIELTKTIKKIHASKQKRKPIIIYSIAASLLVFILSYSLITIINQQNTNKVNPFLENLVGQNLRAGKFILESPRIDEEVSTKEITFIWSTNYKLLNILLLSAEEEVLYKRNNVQSPFSIKNNFNSGIIYWKLETSDELIFVGKFTNEY